jgi:hypothetical protein
MIQVNKTMGSKNILNNYYYREEPREYKLKFQDENMRFDLNHDYENKKLHSDFGHALDSDIARLRMEVNLQQKSLTEQINMTRFKARQTAQERDLAKNELERIIQSVKNKANRFNNHEKPLQSLKDNPQPFSRAERDYTGSSHSRRNLDTYQKLYFNNINNMSQFAHNDGDPFNVNTSAPSQPQMHFNANNYTKSSKSNNYGAVLQSNSQNIGLDLPERNNHNFTKPRPDPMNYGANQFEPEQYNDMQQISIFS